MIEQTIGGFPPFRQNGDVAAFSPPSPWYSLEDDGGEVSVSFLLNDARYWHPKVIQQDPLCGDRMRGRVVILSGGAPLWMYAHAAVVATRAGAKEIRVFQPQIEELVTVFPLEPASVPEAWWRHRDDPAAGTIVEFLPSEAGAKWSPDVLPALAVSVPGWHQQLVTLTGVGANWMYAAAAALAAKVPHRHVAYFTPAETHAILLSGAVDRPILIPPGPGLLNDGGALGNVIGILGDPNSGKSVFSRLLYQGFVAAGVGSVWRLECDFAAPTPDWYLQMVCSRRDEDARALREDQKRDWTHEAEEMLARQLAYCARSLRWVIADFPGGIHKSAPVRRIPPGREVLIGGADHYLLLSRSDRPEIELGWREALAAHGLEDRILAVVESGSPNEPLAFEIKAPDGSRALATGLDRSQLGSPELPGMIASLGDFVRLLTNLISNLKPSGCA